MRKSETVAAHRNSVLLCGVLDATRDNPEGRRMNYTEDLPTLDSVRRDAGRVMLSNPAARRETIAALRDFDQWCNKDDDRVLLGQVDKKYSANVAKAMESGSYDPDQSFYIGYIAVKCQKHEISNPHLLTYKRVREAVVEKNLGLIWSATKRYRGIEYGSFDEDDLRQAGVFGLVRAIDLFNPNHGARFSTYAHWWIRRHIALYITKNREQVREHTCSDLFVTIGGDQVERDELVSKEKPPDLSSEHKEQREIMDAVMCFLTPKERCVIERRFGLFGNPVLRLRDVADQIGLCRERVRQIEIVALDKLKKLMEKNGGWRQG